MFRSFPVRLQSSHRRSGPTARDVGKLLYGKRKNALHSVSTGKPSISTTLMSVPRHQLRQAVSDAVRMNELSRENLQRILRGNRAFNRLDRSDMIVRAAQEAGVRLTPYHYSTLIAHANDNGDFSSAEKYWKDAVHNGSVNEKVHGARMVSLRNAGKWESALEHFDRMLADKMQPDAHALHAVMNTCRRSNAWETSLSVFSRAVDAGTSPNDVVYLELLRCISASTLPAKWVYGLSIINALEKERDLNAGLFNAAIEMLDGSQWRRGVELFHRMREKNVLPSKGTLQAVLRLQPKSTEHSIGCVSEAHSLGLPISDDMYRTVLSNLIRDRKDDEALAFVESEFARSVEDSSNSINRILPLSVATLDCLLAHPRPHDAMLMLQVLEAKIENVVGSATQGLGTMGSASQRWIVQGRVAVVDHNVLLSPLFGTLVGHYDSVLIPFASVRLLVRRIRELVSTDKGSRAKDALRQMQRLTSNGTWSMVRVLPLRHQLYAHTFISGNHTERATREEGAIRMIDEHFANSNAAASPYEQLLLSSQSSPSHHTAETNSSTSPHSSVDVEGEGSFAPFAIRSGDVLLSPAPHNTDGDASQTAVRSRESSDLQTQSQPHHALAAAPSFQKFRNRISSPERVLAVAVMLKSLNPDADVHVVTRSSLLIQLADRWNQTCHTGNSTQTLQTLLFPRELQTKAPSSVQSLQLVKKAQEIARTSSPQDLPVNSKFKRIGRQSIRTDPINRATQGQLLYHKDNNVNENVEYRKTRVSEDGIDDEYDDENGEEWNTESVEGNSASSAARPFMPS